jgi:hypothetical protein
VVSLGRLRLPKLHPTTSFGAALSSGKVTLDTP